MENEWEKNNVPIMNINLESCDVNAKGEERRELMKVCKQGTA